MSGNIVLEFLRVLLTGPVIAGAVAFTCLILFRVQLRGLIARVASIKLPGGGELVAHQQPPEPVEPKAKSVAATVVEPPLLPATLNDQQLALVKELIDNERARAYMWEYRYLNYFLAVPTVRVLQWLSTVATRPTFATYDTLWSSAISDAEQRVIILQVLESHYLIARQGDLLAITDKGREYLEWKDKL